MKKRFVFLGLALITFSCDSLLLPAPEKPVSLAENLAPPPQLGDGWECSSLEAEGVNSQAIQANIERLHQNPHRIRSFLMVWKNKLVVEAYFDGWHRERKQSIRSASKSVTSCLIGMAMDQGHLQSVEQPIFNFFPSYASLKTEQNQHIQLKHVLSMTSGFQWDQSAYAFKDDQNDEGAMVRSSDGIRYVLQKPVLTKPGLLFTYNSGNTQLLAGVIHQTTGMHADVFADQFLFAPLGIRDYFWREQNDHFPNASYGLFLRPRDMAKFGQLFLNQGQWQGKQLLASQWVQASTTTVVGREQDHSGYGYQWWTSLWTIKNQTIRSYRASGNGGQQILVFPSLELVVVFTGGNYDSDQGNLPIQLCQNVILPTMIDQ